MNDEDTVKLLMLVKGNWYRQPTDDLTIRVWQEILGEKIDARDAFKAVMEIARSGAKEPPTPGMVFRAAIELAKRREEQERGARKSIEELPSAEEQERVRQNFSNLLNKLARSVGAGGIDAGVRRGGSHNPECSHDVGRRAQRRPRDETCPRNYSHEASRETEVTLEKKPAAAAGAGGHLFRTLNIKMDGKPGMKVSRGIPTDMRLTLVSVRAG